MDATHLKPILDILMGAAAADGDADIDESDFIADNLYKLGFDERDIESAIDDHDFDPDTFSLEDAAAELTELDDDAKTRLLDFLVELQEADGIIDFSEDDYLRDVATALGVDPDSIQGLVIEVLEEPPSPPPIPTPQDD